MFSGIQYSCSDFLKEMPTDRYMVDSFYSRQTDAEAAVAAVYQQIYSIYGRLMFLVSDLPSDDHKNGLGILNQSAIDIFVLRYADALLMYAEALNETGQTGNAHIHLNWVREREFNSSDFNYSGLTQQDFRETVWQERRLEFAIEGHRWFDLVRTGRFVQRMKDHSILEAQLAESNKVELGQNVGEHMVLMPIPQ